jgi:hypothetical protein
MDEISTTTAISRSMRRSQNTQTSCCTLRKSRICEVSPQLTRPAPQTGKDRGVVSGNTALARARAHVAREISPPGASAVDPPIGNSVPRPMQGRSLRRWFLSSAEAPRTAIPVDISRELLRLRDFSRYYGVPDFRPCLIACWQRCRRVQQQCGKRRANGSRGR